ncbi:3-deoxy-D-manno-octulosonate 8-phosphate phosphatase [Blattabacterium punctulatus]|nr:HAD hydrolase family protein [Blattabacterium punctulatus]AWU44213.1 3-deoxy-D-manno-octulosonate 8-phosphate phosphatase [Blattabacterium punctulatus]AWU45297.1 3-deoxy-D-manno-octulosonate 8-phosphate phosphatase [Blattabacterium punctulatus]
MVNYRNIMKNINTFIFDVDGVLTNCTLNLFPDGNMVRQMFAKDGYAIQLAKDRGYNLCIITRGSDLMVFRRLRDFNIQYIYQGIDNKKKYLDEYCNILNITRKKILYMGDDIPDIEIMKSVALPCSPIDAVPEVKKVSKYISPKRGGRGCVRDVIEQTLKIQKNWL